MFSGILSFLGGSAFRMIFGEIGNFITAKQEHKHEIERLKLEADIDGQRHAREMARIRMQTDLKIQEVRIKGDIDQELGAIQGFIEAQKNFGQPTGVKWVDAWNASVRPAYATVALALWVLALSQQNWVMAAFDIELSAAIAGFFFADRTLMKRGK